MTVRINMLCRYQYNIIMYTNGNIVYGTDANGTCSFVLCSCSCACCNPYIRLLQKKKIVNKSTTHVDVLNSKFDTSKRVSKQHRTT